MKFRKVFSYMSIAAQIACGKDNERTFLLGAIGKRSDGKLVGAPNAAATQKEPLAHAEARLIRKLDKHSTVYVARVLKSDGSFANAKPCQDCIRKLRAAKVKRVYYTLGPNEFGVMDYPFEE